MTDKEVNPVNQALDEAKGKFQTVLVIGLDDKNNIDISSSNNSYVVLQWVLNRAIFELLIHEKANMNTQQKVENV